MSLVMLLALVKIKDNTKIALCTYCMFVSMIDAILRNILYTHIYLYMQCIDGTLTMIQHDILLAAKYKLLTGYLFTYVHYGCIMTIIIL